jgi:O-methyltransferase involved in polyketide biosynthesis
MEDSPVSGPAFTCLFTAALRHIESAQVPQPVLVDTLALHLAACAPKALQLAQEELAGLHVAQGQGKSLRVPARTALLDHELTSHLSQLVSELQQPQPGVVQVVSLGCGMDTRPWRLRPPPGCRVAWFDVDMPSIARLKKERLAAAEAATGPGRATAAADASDPAFPLMYDSYCLMGANLATTSLSDVFMQRGSVNDQMSAPAVVSSVAFNPMLPTVWVLEAVIYYMPLDAASRLLQARAWLAIPQTPLTARSLDLPSPAATIGQREPEFVNLW